MMAQRLISQGIFVASVSRLRMRCMCVPATWVGWPFVVGLSVGRRSLGGELGISIDR